MAENGTRSALPALYTTTGAPGIEQYLVFIYIGVGFLVLLVVCLSVMLVIFVMKRNKMIRQMHPKHDLAGNLPNNDALARYYSLGMNDGASTLKSGLGTLTGKHSTLDRRSNASESVKLSSIHSPNHDSYVVKSNPLFKEEEDNNNAASSDKGYGSQENTATGTIVSEHLNSLNRRDSLDLNSSGSSFEHAAEIHGQQRPALSGHPIYSQDNLAFEDDTQRRPESLAVEELDRALQQNGPSASESALKRISISRRAQISLNREALPPQPEDFSDDCSSSTADSDNESCDNISKLNSIPVIREGHTTPNCSDRRRNRARHSYENTDPFNDNAPLKPPKPPSLSPAARKLSIERHNLNVKLNVAIQGSNTAVVESDRPMLAPPPPSTLPPPLNVDSDNESTLTVQTGVYEDVDVKTPTGNPVDSEVRFHEFENQWQFRMRLSVYKIKLLNWDPTRLSSYCNNLSLKIYLCHQL